MLYIYVLVPITSSIPVINHLPFLGCLDLTSHVASWLNQLNNFFKRVFCDREM